MSAIRGSRGFTLLELVIAMAVVMVIAGAIAEAVQPARVIFDRVPVELDIQQRGRSALEAIAQAVRGSLDVKVSDPTASGAFARLSITVPLTAATTTQYTFR